MAKEKNSEQLIGGYVLIILGVVLSLNILIGWNLMWPLFIAFPGLITLSVYLLEPKNKGAIVPTGLLLTIAVFFLLFTTGIFNWSAMSWLWPVFILAPGIGLISYYFVSGDSGALTGAGVLIVLFLIFISVFSLNLWNYWPAILIIIGLIIVIKQSRKK